MRMWEIRWVFEGVRGWGLFCGVLLPVVIWVYGSVTFVGKDGCGSRSGKKGGRFGNYASVCLVSSCFAVGDGKSLHVRSSISFSCSFLSCMYTKIKSFRHPFSHLLVDKQASHTLPSAYAHAREQNLLLLSPALTQSCADLPCTCGSKRMT